MEVRVVKVQEDAMKSGSHERAIVMRRDNEELFITIAILQYQIGYLLVPVNSADSTEFTGTFTIPYLDNEYTNQTCSLLNILFRISH